LEVHAHGCIQIGGGRMHGHFDDSDLLGTTSRGVDEKHYLHPV
jgi:hypothetical protein